MLFGEGAGGFGLAQLFEVRGEGGQVGQGFLVVGAFLAAGCSKPRRSTSA